MLSFIFFMNMFCFFLQHSCETVPDNRKTVGLPFLPVYVFLADGTKLIAMNLLGGIESKSGVESFLVPPWFSKM